MTGKTTEWYDGFTISKSGAKWKVTSSKYGMLSNKVYPGTYSLQKAYKTYLNYALRKIYTTGGQ